MSLLLSKLGWAILAPGNLLVLILLLGLILQTASQLFWQKIGRCACWCVVIILMIISTLPVGQWALTPLENRFAFDPPEQVDGIIVLGGDEQAAISQLRGMPVAQDSMRRYVAFTDLARRYPDAKLVFSGGSAFAHPHVTITEADVAKGALMQIGAPVEHMIFEKNSRNTWENAVYSADIVHPARDQKWLLVTSAWHMPRAMGCFRKAGWNVYAAPTGYYTGGTYGLYYYFRFDEQLHFLTMAAHEYLGLISYWLLGRSSALWPG